MLTARALIIDNESKSTRNLSFFLKKMGFVVEEETDPFRALEKLHNGDSEYDIILIEQNLPILSGINILKDLQSFNCKSCVIFMTETPELNTVVSLLQEGAFSFLEKPIDYNNLEIVVKKGLENRKAFFEIVEMSDNLRTTNVKLKKQREKLKKEKTSLKQINQELNVLNQLSLQINSTLDIHKMVDKIAHSKLNELIDHGILTFFYFIEDNTFLKIYSPAFSLSNDVIKRLINNSIDEYNKHTGQKLSPDNIHTEVIKGRAGGKPDNKIRIITPEKKIYIPLEVANNVLGIMGLMGTKTLGKNQLRFLSTMSNQVALALKNGVEHQKVQELAITDELTGLHNRRAFHDALDRELQRSKRYQKSLSLIMLDIDGFKGINDAFGHQVGDDVLKSLAVRLQGAVRETDLLARYGGDEFAIILPETKAGEAVISAERLKNTVKNYSFKAEGTHHSVTLSIGIADVTNGSTDSRHELINRADSLLYTSKGHGGNSVKVSCNSKT